MEPCTYTVSVDTPKGVVTTSGLTKPELRQRVDAWFKNEHEIALHIETIPKEQTHA